MAKSISKREKRRILCFVAEIKAFKHGKIGIYEGNGVLPNSINQNNILFKVQFS
ncbi:hypothetical protein [Bacillus solitudinis]|uniref:hypothetical protein n=1 Tax=Bacillus solitudinis TaxID=2014074 RepID=UPI0012FDC357|nr:hypothetical protein [Bacillus solitudinis]